MSLHGRTIAIRGNVDCVEDVLIEGRIDGHIWNENHVVTVGADAVVKGDIVARMITVRGEVEGTMMATGRVDIMNEARVTGRVLVAAVHAGRGRHVQRQGRAAASGHGDEGRAPPARGVAADARRQGGRGGAG